MPKRRRNKGQGGDAGTNVASTSLSSSSSSSGGGGWASLPWRAASPGPRGDAPPLERDDDAGPTGPDREEFEETNAVCYGLEVVDGSRYEVVRTETKDGDVETEVVVRPAEGVGCVGGGSEKDETTMTTTREKSAGAGPKTRTRTDEAKTKVVGKDSSDDDEKRNVPSRKRRRETVATETAPPADDADVERLRASWSIACGGALLHPALCRGLAARGYDSPTPIQAACLAPAILGRRNVVGAAPTGSGKTLAYGLPVLERILSSERSDPDERPPLTALVLCPTRELALQVSEELRRVAGADGPRVGTIVGGLAEQKQRRVLDKVRPPVLVATPGRLWELMSSEKYSHLTNLDGLRFLVVDEADRMISQGSFPQLKQILEYIERNSPSPPEDEDDSGDDDESDSEDEDRLRPLQGVRGEARVVMLDPSMLEQAAMLAKEEAPRPLDEPEDDDDATETSLEVEDAQDRNDAPKYVPRQTFIFSATLTLPSALLGGKRSDNKDKRRRQDTVPNSVDGAIADILERTGAVGRTKVIDLTTSTKDGGAVVSNTSSGDAVSRSQRLPPGLSLHQILCAQRRKDSYCYAWLATTAAGSSGPCLVFCNSVRAVVRVGATLQRLGLPARTLHARMAQKARLSALESLRTPGSRAVVVATDVAARGLDVPSVATVVHYDAARAVDTFVHRAGRTARGVGEKAVGRSLSLIAPGNEEKQHARVREALGLDEDGFAPAALDVRLLEEANKRANLAAKIVAYDDDERRVHRDNQWFVDAAAAADLDLDEDELLEDVPSNKGDPRDRARTVEVARAKAELRRLLARPMRRQNHGKFLSGAGMAASVRTEAAVVPYVVDTTNTTKVGKRRRRRR